MRPCCHPLRIVLTIICIGVLGLVVALVFGLSALEVGSPASTAAPPVSLAASVDIARPGKPVPRDFLGLSFEMSSLAHIARYGVRGNMVALLRALGPGLMRFGGTPSWAPPVALHDGISALTGHHYPTGCNSVPPPTIPRLLSPAIRHDEAVSLQRYLAVSSRLHMPFRLDEANSVSCGGTPGISDRFASTLWAIDYIARTMTFGASGINLQANPSKCLGYTPLCAPSPSALADGVLDPHPEWYALLMARQLLRDRPLRVTFSPTLSNVDVLAFLSDSGALHVLVVNDEPSQPAALRLHLPHRYRLTTELSLSAPSLAAASGVRLVRRTFEANGESDDASSSSPRRIHDGRLVVETPPSTAILLTLR
jgi:hypothetical protein